MRDKTGVANRLREHIARTVVQGAELDMESILMCLTDKPAQIMGLRFERNHAIVRLEWPIFDSQPDDNDDEHPLRNIKRFRKQFRNYLLEQHIGKQLANLLYGELVDFLPRYLQAVRFGSLSLKDGLTVQESLSTFGKRFKAGRLAGPKQQRLPYSIPALRKEAQKVFAVIVKVQQMLEVWAPDKESEEALREKLFETFEHDTYPWMRHFSSAFSKLGIRDNAAFSSTTKATLSNPNAWSPVLFTRLIIREKLLYETGIWYPESIFKKILAVPRRKA